MSEKVIMEANRVYTRISFEDFIKLVIQAHEEPEVMKSSRMWALLNSAVIFIDWEKLNDINS